MVAYTIGARTVVVFHGGGSIAEAAHPCVIPLERDFRVVAVDWPVGATRVDDVVDALSSVMVAEALSRVSLLGFSLGGMLAQGSTVQALSRCKGRRVAGARTTSPACSRRRP
jgi:pimeloyl-ACP methyl ester carboxylesterase